MIRLVCALLVPKPKRVAVGLLSLQGQHAERQRPLKGEHAHKLDHYKLDHFRCVTQQKRQDPMQSLLVVGNLKKANHSSCGVGTHTSADGTSVEVCRNIPLSIGRDVGSSCSAVHKHTCRDDSSTCTCSKLSLVRGDVQHLSASKPGHTSS